MSAPFVATNLLRALMVRGNTRASTKESLAAAMHWLNRAHDATADGGVSIRYSLLRGWESSYPETTGYIIPTYLNYADHCGDDSWRQRAVRMAEWEVSIQQDDGSWIGGAFAEGVGKLVFDTGQIMFGLICAFQHSDDAKYLEAARRAGDWLVDCQDDDGAWRRNSFNDRPHTYHTRVGWPLALLGAVTGDQKYSDAGAAMARWCKSQQRDNGWFDSGGFTSENNTAPYTHTIAYTIRGLLETGTILNDSEIVAAAKRSADAVLPLIRNDGFLYGRLDSQWHPVKRFSCLTGNAQMSIIYAKLFNSTGDNKYRQAYLVLNKYLRRMQVAGSLLSHAAGAIPGSRPIWGEYERLGYPNWATKFFADAALLELGHQDRFAG